MRRRAPSRGQREAPGPSASSAGGPGGGQPLAPASPDRTRLSRSVSRHRRTVATGAVPWAAVYRPGGPASRRSGISVRRFSMVAVLGAVLAVGVVPVAAPAATSCNGVPKRGCLLPFPNDYAQTKRDASTPTERRVALSQRSAHARERQGRRRSTRASGTATTASARASRSWCTSRSSRTQAQFARSGIVPVNDLAKYRSAAQPLLLLDERTGQRQIVWGELDAGDRAGRAAATSSSTRRRTSCPAAATWWSCATWPTARPRGLWRTTSRALRKALRRRRSRARASTSPGTSPWPATVAHRAAAEDPRRRLRAARRPQPRRRRDRRARRRPTRSPASRTSPPAQDPRIARRIAGTFTVPCYLDKHGLPARRPLPLLEPKARTRCPRRCRATSRRRRSSATSRGSRSPRPSRISLYGHGLLGSATRRSTRTTSRT